MGEKGYANNTKIRCTIKNIIRSLSIILIALTFCPTFLVSCSGYEVKISAMDVVKGIKVNGSTASSGKPMYIITLLLPLAIFIILLLKQFYEKQAVLIISICAATDLIVWLIFRSAIKSAAEENYCDFKSTFGFALCIILNLLIIIVSILVFINRVSLETDIIAIFSDNEIARNTVNHMSSAVYRTSNKVSKIAGDISSNTVPRESMKPAGLCTNCGTVVKQGNMFCIKCGSPVIQEEPKEYEELLFFCPNCGQQQEPGAVFCHECGYSLKEY